MKKSEKLKLKKDLREICEKHFPENFSEFVPCKAATVIRWQAECLEVFVSAGADPNMVGKELLEQYFSPIAILSDDIAFRLLDRLPELSGGIVQFEG